MPSDTNTTWRIPSSLEDRSPPTVIRPLRVHVEDYLEAASVEPHSHPEYGQLLATTSGVIRIYTDDDYWVVPPGKALLLPPNVTHTVHCPLGTRLRAVVIARSVFKDNKMPCRVVTVSALLNALIDAFGNLHGSYSIPSSASRMADVFIDQFNLLGSDLKPLERPRDVRLRRVTDALNEQPDDMRPLSEWGIVAGASSRTLERLFQAELGMSFAHYRRQIQIHSSIAMLLEGTPVGLVAYNLGYSSASSFGFAFRSVMGMSPSRWIKEHNDTAVNRVPASSRML